MPEGVRGAMEAEMAEPGRAEPVVEVQETVSGSEPSAEEVENVMVPELETGGHEKVGEGVSLS